MKRITRFLPLLVIVVGVGFRWYGLNWALPYTFHPDETRLLYAVNDLSFKDLDFHPDFFAYGSLPIYLLKITYEAAKILLSPRVNFFLVGRILSAIWGSLTLILLYRFGKRFFTPRVACLATTFLALTVLHIQASHFLTVDGLLTLLTFLALYLMAALVNDFTPVKHYLLIGVVIGLAIATKISALPLYGIFLGAHILLLLRIRWDRASFQALPARSILRRTRSSALWLWGSFGVGLLLSGLVFIACEPYALLDFKEFSRQITEQSNMVRGITQPPYTIQYEGTPVYLYPIQQLVRYSLGIPLGLLTLTGTLVLLFRTVFGLSRLPRRVSGFPTIQALMVLWILSVFLIAGGFQVKFLRYMLPLIPVMCVLSAIWIDQMIQRFPGWKTVIGAGVLGVIGYSGVYSVAFLSIYTQEDPRVQMSKWVYKHIESDALILTESWEFVSLVPVKGQHPGQYRTETLDLYGPDTEPKLRQIARQLSEADAVILATKRLYGSILRVPERYPLTTRYYQQLFNGTLGFGKVEAFVNYPSIGPITFIDDFADESFTVYDHPKTLFFQKTFDLSAEQIYERIMTSPAVEKPEQLLERLLAFPYQENRLMPAEVIHLPKDNAPALPTRYSSQTSSWLASGIWFITVELFGIIGIPVAMLFFRNLPDAGYSTAKVFGLLLPGYAVWLVVSLHLAPFREPVILGIVAVFLVLSIGILVRFWPYFRARFRQTWRIFLFQEGVFVIAFCGFLLFRAYNPDIFWSESSMDFSIVNALVRTDTFPPPDPWFSGAPLNYYYFGHYLVALLTKFTGIAPQYTYNLAFALIPALVATEVFSILYNLTRRYIWGWIGVLFATLLGNLDGFFLLIATWRDKVPLLDSLIGRETWLDDIIGTELYYRIFRPAHEVIRYTVHEFPLWTFIFVDLHAHLLNMPFLVAIFLVGLNVISPPSWPISSEMAAISSSKTVLVLTFFLLMLLLGTLGVISSWDYPTAVIFLLLCVMLTLVRSYRSNQQPASGSVWRQLLLLVGVGIPGSVLLYQPFYAQFSRQGMGVGLVGGATTPFSSFVTVFGFFLWIILAYLLRRFVRVPGSLTARIGLAAMAGAAIGGWLVVNQTFHRNYATLLFSLCMVALSSYVLLKDELFAPDSEPGKRYGFLCVIYAGLITAGCELVFVKDFLQGGEYKRMNTIFKFYLPAWYLLAFAAAYALFLLWQHWKPVLLAPFSRTGTVSQPASPAIVWPVLAVTVVLFLMAATFPMMATFSRRQNDFYKRQQLMPTLNGLEFLAKTNPDEYLAIAWLNDHVIGTPVILEAVHDDYRYEYARISANTGLPTVLGWPSHADQREHWGQTHQRRLDVTEIYATSDVRHAYYLLQKYQVRYVYVGRTERQDFSAEQLQKFQNSSEYFIEVFRSDETVIYEVR